MCAQILNRAFERDVDHLDKGSTNGNLDPEDRQAVVDQTITDVIERATGYHDYYVHSASKMGKRAKHSRGFALVATAVAGILPVLIALAPNAWNPEQFISPAWASVLLALAGIVLALDRFFGYSSSWMRFTKAAMDIQKHLDVFNVEIEALRVAWRDGEPNIKQAQEALEKCREFVHAVDDLACCETQTWCDEFRSALEKFSDVKAEELVSANAGAIEVNVPQDEKLADGWTLTIDGKPSEKHFGSTGTFNGLPAGMHRIVVDGTKNGDHFAWEKIVTVEPRKVVKVDLSLS